MKKSKNQVFFRSIYSLFRIYPKRFFVILTLSLIASFAEGLGIAGLLPLLNLSIEQDSNSSSTIFNFISDLFLYLGVNLDIGNILLLVVFLMLVKITLTSLVLILSGYSVALVSKKLRESLSSSLLFSENISYSDISGGSSAALMSSEINRASSMYVVVTKFIMNLVRSTILFCLAFIVSPEVSILVLIVSSVVYIALHRFQKSNEEAGRLLTNSMRRLSSDFVDFLKMIKPIKIMGETGLGLKILNKETRQIYRSSKKQTYNLVVVKAIHEIVPVIIVSIIFFIAYTVYSIDFSEIFVSLMVFYRFYNSVSEVQKLSIQISGIKDAFTQVFSSLSLSECYKSSGSRKADGGISLASGIGLCNVFYSCNGVNIIKGMNVNFKDKSLNVLTGHSGSGKTTTLDLITGFIKPDSGHIVVNNSKLSNIDMNDWRSIVGYVAQEPILLNSTLINNIRLWDESIPEYRVYDALVAVGLEDLANNMHTNVGEHGSKLSGGQRQRVSIARAIVREPKLLILDEVTSNLDRDSEVIICNLIKKMSKNIMIVAISHQPLMIEIADRVISIDNGSVDKVLE